MLKRFFLLIIILIPVFFSSYRPASAADICCLPGYTPENNECVYSDISGLCNSITSKICDIELAGQTLCSVVQPSDITNVCVSTFYAAGGIVSPSTICQTLGASVAAIIPIPGVNVLASGLIYASCVPAVESFFNGLPNLGGLIKTPSLCDTGMGNRFYFCYIGGDPNNPGVPTALGCIPYQTAAFVSSALTWSLGIGGGIAFLVIVWGSILVITQGHDPKKIQAGQEMITAALAGMAMIVISVLLINYLGDKVLNLGPLGFRQ